jgi:hypothetical protein
MASGANHYMVGSSVTVTGTYTNRQTGALTDPTDAKVDVVDPKGRKITYTYLNAEVVKISTGIFTYDVDTTGQPGRWQYRWWSPAGTSVQVAAANQFIVDPFPLTTP